MNTKKKNKRTTIDDLARIMKIGFDATASKKDLAKLEERMISVEEKIVSMQEEMATKEELNKILAALDKAAKNYNRYSEEKAMRDAEIARIKKWVEQIAKKVGIELE